MNTPFKAILVDDERLAIERLKRLLQAHKNHIEIVDSSMTGIDAVAKINKLKPDVIFLDIQMPGLNGFEVIDKLESMPWIIFCSAYDEYALSAFETNAVDYLLKPVDPARLQKAIHKLQRMTSRDKQHFETQLANLMSTINKQSSKRIQVRSGDQIQLLNIQDIYFFRASDKYVEVHTYDEYYLLSQPLKELENQLPGDDFVRIHRALIVNLNHMERIVHRYGSSYRLIMKNKQKSELPVSRNFKSNLGI